MKAGVSLRLNGCVQLFDQFAKRGIFGWRSFTGKHGHGWIEPEARDQVMKLADTCRISIVLPLFGLDRFGGSAFLAAKDNKCIERSGEHLPGLGAGWIGRDD